LAKILMSLRVEIVKREKLLSRERDEMFAVFSRYYENVNFSRFEADLAGKNWVILLEDQSGAVVGFSTLQKYRHAGNTGAAVILYSGDTIVDRAHRTNGHLAGAFGHFLLRAIEESDGLPVYWLLTSKGVRTYRFLPVFFKTFWPVHSQPTPADVKRLIDEVAAAKFGPAYSAATQLIAHHRQRDRLCGTENDPLLLGRPNAHVQFFLQQNPEFAAGDELVCLAEMSHANLNSRGWRVIKHTEVRWRE
jgi:hypothetical protein